MTDNRQQGGAGDVRPKSTNTPGAPRAIITPSGHLDLCGAHVTRAEFCRICELVRLAFFTDPRDEAAGAELDVLLDRGFARAAEQEAAR